MRATDYAAPRISPKIGATSNGDYLDFGINDYNNSSQCAQSYVGTGQVKGLVVYVKNVPFGGNIGTQDAIVDDGYSGQSSSQDHVERAFYVLGYGVVRYGVAFYDPGDGLYDNKPHYDGIWNEYQMLNPNDFNIEPASCPQGSAVPLWPSSTEKVRR